MFENKKNLIAAVGCKNGRTVTLDGEPTADHSLSDIARECDNNGVDALLIWDFSADDADHERTIGQIRVIARSIDIPIITGGHVRRLEDVKKYLYAGAKAVFLDGGDAEQIDRIKEAADRFGSEKIYVYLRDESLLVRATEFVQLGATAMILDARSAISDAAASGTASKVTSEATSEFSSEAARVISKLLDSDSVSAVILPVLGTDFIGLRQSLLDNGLPMEILTSTVSWDQFRLNGDGLIPVIVQDYKTSEVLMLAYMNEQAFADTLRTGRMHYYSRSRQSQWMKGETSGHFQYVKSLHLDCDNDTLLAKVHQIGAACHTGSRSCFFQTLVQKPYRETNPLNVFEDVFAVILDRKEHPKEGSYTNYLFDKGIDKILKKVGEEATEIVIAAKNPDPEEIKYEISDFLYHVMVLMAEKGVTWEEIMEELANR
ncbi:MAG: bifunctional phosphoribosyl-AMP cyclohydrolase/phosphoribosyl-ATP diphosphatase HisIE [Clostridiales bacterium]|nr:bifunctional phosphoribosyl-AMP cyclohydrolase/phosphoribosyl-ATP diphosphatase HisIE [Clostridiales bacterium]